MSKFTVCFVTNTFDVDIHRLFNHMKEESYTKTLIIPYEEHSVAMNMLQDLGVRDFSSFEMKALLERLTKIGIDTGKFFESLQEKIKEAFEDQMTAPDNILVLVQTKNMNQIKPTINYLLPAIVDTTICGSAIELEPMCSAYFKAVNSKDVETVKQNRGVDFNFKFDLGEAEDSAYKAGAKLLNLLTNKDEK